MGEEDRLEKARRAARVARIIERLPRLDDRTLEALDRSTAEAISGAASPFRPGVPAGGPVTRRRFLGAAGVGAAIVALTGGVFLWQSGSERIAALQAQIADLEQALALYDELEAVGLDAQVEQGLTAVGTPLDSARRQAEAITPALDAVRADLRDVQSRLSWFRGRLDTLSQLLLGLENEVNQALNLSVPLDEAIGGFLAEVLAALDRRDAERLSGGLERLGEVIGALPTTLQSFYTRLLQPLEGWLGGESADGESTLDPLPATLLAPVEALAEDVLDLAATWEQALAQSLPEPLSARQAIRQELARLRPTVGNR